MLMKVVQTKTPRWTLLTLLALLTRGLFASRLLQIPTYTFKPLYNIEHRYCMPNMWPTTNKDLTYFLTSTTWS